MPVAARLWSGMASLRIDIWSDISCPWCYMGKRHLEQALDKFPHKADVQIVWRAFELDPSAPRVPDRKASFAELLQKKTGASKAQTQQMIDQVVGAAARVKIEMRVDRILFCNTFDGHRLLHFAHERGKQGELKERLMRAYFTDGVAIGDRDALAKLAGEVGLSEQEAREMLETDRYTREVRADQSLARELGVSGVPFYMLAGKIGVSGAQPADVMLGALNRAWSEVAKSGIERYAEGATCDTDGNCD